MAYPQPERFEAGMAGFKNGPFYLLFLLLLQLRLLPYLYPFIGLFEFFDPLGRL